MARIRSIKPDFWDSADTARASLRTRLLYIAMWNWADDYGIGDATPLRLIGFAFPNDNIPAADYPTLLSDVRGAFGVVYFEHAGRPYYVIPAWEAHQRTEKKAKAREGLVEAAKAAIAADQGADADSPTDSADVPTPSGGSSGAGSRKGERGNRGTGEDEAPLPEPPDDPYEPIDAEVVEPPTQIDNPSRPQKVHPSNAAKSVVRQTLGNDYPRVTVDRLAAQVEKLAREGHSDALIRESLTAWDKRRNAIPEWLPTVLGDVVKEQRAAPAKVHKLRGYAQLAEEVRAQEAQSRKELA